MKGHSLLHPQRVFRLLTALSVSAAPHIAVTQNYVRIIEPDHGSTSEPAADATTARVTTLYHDGLGRPVQTVLHGQGGSGEDIVSLMEYDIYGNPVIEWIPVGIPGNGGQQVCPPEFHAAATSFHAHVHPYTRTGYEPSVRRLPVYHYRAGMKEPSTDKYITYRESTNSTDRTSDSHCRYFRCDLNGTALLDDGLYDRGTRRDFPTPSPRVRRRPTACTPASSSSTTTVRGCSTASTTTGGEQLLCVTAITACAK